MASIFSSSSRTASSQSTGSQIKTSPYVAMGRASGIALAQILSEADALTTLVNARQQAVTDPQSVYASELTNIALAARIAANNASALLSSPSLAILMSNVEENDTFMSDSRSLASSPSILLSDGREVTAFINSSVPVLKKLGAVPSLTREVQLSAFGDVARSLVIGDTSLSVNLRKEGTAPQKLNLRGGRIELDSVSSQFLSFDKVLSTALSVFPIVKIVSAGLGVTVASAEISFPRPTEDQIFCVTLCDKTGPVLSIRSRSGDCMTNACGTIYLEMIKKGATKTLQALSDRASVISASLLG